MKALKLIFDPLNLMTGMQQAIKLAHHCLGAELYELSISNFPPNQIFGLFNFLNYVLRLFE